MIYTMNLYFIFQALLLIARSIVVLMFVLATCSIRVPANATVSRIFILSILLLISGIEGKPNPVEHSVCILPYAWPS